MNYLCLILFSLGLSIVPTVRSDYINAEDSTTEKYVLKNENKTTNCECGRANKVKRDLRIIGGEETKVNEYPMMAGLMYAPKKSLFCGGTIISQWHVFTAAHCTEPLEDHVDLLKVVVGEHDQDKVAESSASVTLNVKHLVIHEDYNLVGHRNDVSIVETESRIPYSEAIGPACLPTAAYDMVGRKIKILGWGKLSTQGPSSNVLIQVKLNVVPLEECTKELEYIDLFKRKQVCTHHRTKDSCQDDSGGPVLWLDEEINRYVLVAITSYGHSCAANIPAVNTDIFYYMPWIRKVVSETRPDATICTKVG